MVLRDTQDASNPITLGDMLHECANRYERRPFVTQSAHDSCFLSWISLSFAVSSQIERIISFRRPRIQILQAFSSHPVRPVYRRVVFYRTDMPFEPRNT